MRLFIALLPPPPVVQALERLSVAAVAHFEGRATQPETLHLTLAFLGEVAPEMLSAVECACAEIANDPALAGGFELRLDRLACWRHNRLLWAGCQMPPEALLRLAEGLRQRLSEPGGCHVGMTPHVTLVRRVAAVDRATEVSCEALLADVCPQGLPVWPVGGLALVESRLLAAGAEHRVRMRYAFGGGNSVASG